MNMAATESIKGPGWSRAQLMRPKENLTHHAPRVIERFIPSYERDNCPVSMNLILSWEYARIWQREHDQFRVKLVKAAKKKFIKNDFEWWLRKRVTNKRFCCIR